MGNGKYHSRLIEKTLSMSMKKDNMIKFFVKYDIDIPSSITIKPVLLGKNP